MSIISETKNGWPVTLLYEMQKREAKKGLATLCIGGGMGIAMCVERD